MDENAHQLSIRAYVKVIPSVKGALAEVKFVQALGGQVIGIEKHCHFDYDSYTLRAVVPNDVL